MNNTSWQQDALCAHINNADLFYPENRPSQQRANEAKKICHHCDVRIQCLRYALAHHETFGIWGGTSEHERRHLRNQGAA